MSRDPVAVDVDDSESHAAELFLHDLRSLPVVGAEGQVTGVVRLADMVESLLRACGALPPGPGPE